MSRSDQDPSTAHGDATCTVEQLKQLLREFVSQRHWQRFHTPKNLSMSISIEAAELMEHFQWLTEEEARSGAFDRSEVADELADIACYVISLANALDIDLSQAMHAKMVKNRLKYPIPEQPETTGWSARKASQEES